MLELLSKVFIDWSSKLVVNPMDKTYSFILIITRKLSSPSYRFLIIYHSLHPRVFSKNLKSP